MFWKQYKDDVLEGHCPACFRGLSALTHLTEITILQLLIRMFNVSIFW